MMGTPRQIEAEAETTKLKDMKLFYPRERLSISLTSVLYVFLQGFDQSLFF